DLRPAEAAGAVERGQQGGTQNRGSAEAGTFGHGAEQRNFQTSSEGGELGPQAGPRPAGKKVRMKTSQRQGGFGQAETRPRIAVGGESGITGDNFRRAQVDRAQPEEGLLQRADENLDRRLAVEQDGDVQYRAAMVQAEGRGVRPAARQIEPHGTASPHDLILLEGKQRPGARQLLG